MLLLAMLLSISDFAMAHEKKHDAHQPVPTVETKSDYARINDMYISDVKPIFEKKCFNCHGIQNYFPWYRNLPLVKQLIDHDLRESKTHLDLTNDFPFKSHSTPFEDLMAIQKSIQANKMPPFRYRLVHLNSTLSASEKEKVFNWVKFGTEALNKSSK